MDVVLWLIAAFAGGAFGAAIGPQTAFIFTTVLYLIALGAAAGDVEGANAMFGNIVFGPVFGPHIAFAGGAAASAYAAWKGFHPNGRDIVTPLPVYERLDVYVIGGIFGIIGYVMNALFQMVPSLSDGAGNELVFTDTVAMSVVGVAIVARLCFGQRSKSPVGPFAKGVSPFGVEEGHHWVQHQERYSISTAIGLFFGLLFAFATAWLIRGFPENEAVTGNAFLFGWGIAGVSLIFITFGHKTPVTHHMGLVAGLGATVLLRIFTGGDFTQITDTDMLLAVLFGGVMGAVSGFLGEVLSRLTNARGDTHIDPPAFAIFPLTTVLVLVQVAFM